MVVIFIVLIKYLVCLIYQEILADKQYVPCKALLIKGREWAYPSQLGADFLAKADVGLDNIEQLANQMLLEVGK